MSIRTILTGEDEPVLHKVCHPVTSFDQKLADLLDDMKETLAKANGVGLAAPQVGILRRAVIVVNDQDEMLELVNPETVAISVGAENRYGHPAAETRERIAEIGAEVYRTDLQGTITIRG